MTAHASHTPAPARSPRVAEQFDDLDQQHHAATLGMWTFLATEILFFGALFTGYLVMRIRFPEAFAQGSRHLVLWIGGTNTALLLLSSFTVALAVAAARHAARRVMLASLVATILLGSAFLVLKGVEYSIDYRESLVPVIRFDPAPFTHPARTQLFLILYFTMTALHAVHMTIGVGVWIVLLVLAFKGRFTPEYHSPLEVAGLYWHFVDIVWIVLLPLLYLVR